MDIVKSSIDRMVNLKREGKTSEIDSVWQSATEALQSLKDQERGLLEEIDGLTSASTQAREELDALALKRHNFRMLFELRQRRLQDEAKEERLRRREAIEASLRAKTDLSASLQSKVRDVHKDMRGIERELDVAPMASRDGSDAVAELLPGPLHVLYRQVQAHVRMYDDPASVSVQWTDKDAAEKWRNDAMSEYQVGQDREEQRAAKRRRIAGLRGDPSLNRRAPFSVSLEVRPLGTTLGGSAPAPLRIVFEYLDRLDLLVARCAVPDSRDAYLLVEVLPGDTGHGLPSEELDAALGGGDFNPSSLGRPFVWCQKLAMLDIIPTCQPFAYGTEDGAAARSFDAHVVRARSEARVASVLRVLRARLAAAHECEALLAKLKLCVTTKVIVKADLVGTDVAASLSDRYRTAGPATLTKFYRTTSKSRRGDGARQAGAWDAPLEVYKASLELGSGAAARRVEAEVTHDTAFKARPTLRLDKVGGGNGATPEILAELARRINAACDKELPEGREGVALGVLLLAAAVECQEYLADPETFAASLLKAAEGGDREGEGLEAQGGDAACAVQLEHGEAQGRGLENGVEAAADKGVEREEGEAMDAL